MGIPETIKTILDRHGTTQAWVIARMNAISPELQMNRNKFSSIVCGSRKMTGDELIAFCKATTTDPDAFIARADDTQGSA